MLDALPQLRRVASSSVAAVGYDPDTRRLYVRFVSGRAYVYYAVPPGVYRKFLAADSKGGFVNGEIRGAYAYKRL